MENMKDGGKEKICRRENETVGREREQHEKERGRRKETEGHEGDEENGKTKSFSPLRSLHLTALASSVY
jgi:hypothetical protein